MKEEDVLSGFSAVFNEISGKIDPESIPGVELSGSDMDEEFEIEDRHQVDEDENNAASVNETDDDDSIDNNDLPEDGDVNNDTDDDGNPIYALFDAIAESAGWGDVPKEQKPKDAESLVEYIKNVTEENSKPKYANEMIAELDEYVRNGGDPASYFSVASGNIDYDNIDISNEHVQKAVIREFLAEKGFSDTQIKKKLEKYEDADILEDEAIDAVESLKEIMQDKRKALLEEQRIAHATMIEEQQKFYNNVIGEIEALTDIRGIKIPKQDKQSLMEYIFKVESDGKTKYQKDYARSTKNLIESAYFTMKGDSLINSAKQSGETSAVEKLKNTLNSTKVSGSKQRIENRSAQPLWSVASSHLLRRPQ